MNSIDIPGPGTATALLAAVAIYTAGTPSHLSDFWRGAFFVFALGALVVTVIIEYWARPKSASGGVEE